MPNAHIADSRPFPNRFSIWSCRFAVGYICVHLLNFRTNYFRYHTRLSNQAQSARVKKFQHVGIFDSNMHVGIFGPTGGQSAGSCTTCTWRLLIGMAAAAHDQSDRSICSNRTYVHSVNRLQSCTSCRPWSNQDRYAESDAIGPKRTCVGYVCIRHNTDGRLITRRLFCMHDSTQLQTHWRALFPSFLSHFFNERYLKPVWFLAM